MDLEIKIASKKDLENILALQKECYLEEAKIYDDYSIPPLTQSLESILEEFKTHAFLKIELNEKLVGSVRIKVEGDTCFIGRLIVHKKYQNKGIGKKLMLSIEKMYSQVNRLELFTGHKSTKNLSFYKKLGYYEFKRKRVNENLNLIFLEKIN